MANEDDSARPQELKALEERVARLEFDLAALRRQMSGEAPQPVMVKVAPEVRATPPPPPPPPPRMPAAAAAGMDAARAGFQRLEAWEKRPAAAGGESLESRLGSQIFNRIAIVLLLVGAAYFMKLAVDRGWINPAARVIAGLIAGAALVVWSERFRRNGYATFSYSLKAVGSGVLYLSLWAAFHLFDLIPASVALVLMVLVTAWNGYMAWAQDSELLAAYALAGGFATPMLLSTGENHETFLFTYLLAIDVAMVALVRLRAWPRLLLGAFPLTVAFFVGWYVEFYRTEALGLTSVFIALFGAAFASVPLLRNEDEKAEVGGRLLRRMTLLEDILLPLANAAFVALAFYSVLQDAGHHDWLPWEMVVLAAMYLGVMRVRQTAVASAIHLSIAVVLLTIAVPLKASGHWITVSWLVEGLALLWVATRLTGDAAGAYATRTLRWLGVGSLLLGFCGVCVHVLAITELLNAPLWNDGLGTALTGVAVFAAVAWLAMPSGQETGRGQAEDRHAWGTIAVVAFLLIVVIAGLLSVRELGTSWFGEYPSNAHPAFQSADFFTALVGLVILAGVIATSLRVAAERVGEEFWTNCAAIATIGFNLIAVLTGVREVSAVWAPPPNAWNAEAGLQQALAISGFLMLYGAVLLGVGFWRRSGFLRWQALVLLVFTIGKTFLYDMRSLSQGYRVASLLGLGALLMAISFAYQKDWLNLRGAEEKRGVTATAGKDAGGDAGAAG